GDPGEDRAARMLGVGECEPLEPGETRRWRAGLAAAVGHVLRLALRRPFRRDPARWCLGQAGLDELPLPGCVDFSRTRFESAQQVAQLLDVRPELGRPA